MSHSDDDTSLQQLISLTGTSPELAQLALDRSFNDINGAAIQLLDHRTELSLVLSRRQQLQDERERSHRVLEEERRLNLRRRQRSEEEEEEEVILDFDPCEIEGDSLCDTFLINRRQYCLLGVPQSRSEYEARFCEYNEGKEDRKAVFYQESHESYALARQLYAQAFALCRFACEASFGQIVRQVVGSSSSRNVDDDVGASDGTDVVADTGYSDDEHSANIRKCAIVIRKIGECCFYLGRISEGVDCCLKGIAFCDLVPKYGLKSITWYLRGVLAKLYVLKKNYDRAQFWLSSAFDIKPESPFLRKTRRFIQEAEEGKPPQDGPEFLRMKEAERGIVSKWYPGDEVVLERLQFVKHGLVTIDERFKFAFDFVEGRYPFAAYLRIVFLQKGIFAFPCMV